MKKNMKTLIEIFSIIILAILTGLVISRFSISKEKPKYTSSSENIAADGIGIYGKNDNNSTSGSTLCLDKYKNVTLVLDNKTTLSANKLNIAAFVNTDSNGIKINKDKFKSTIKVLASSKQDVLIDLNELNLKNDVNILSYVAFTDIDEPNNIMFSGNYLLVKDNTLIDSKSINFENNSSYYIKLNISDYATDSINNQIKKSNEKTYIKCSTNLESLDNLNLYSLEHQLKFEVKEISKEITKTTFTLALNSSDIKDGDYLFLANLSQCSQGKYFSSISNIVKIIR
ncbi:hypothetical protein [Clostridium sp. C8-1-8]|uniref:hypothetical protein n=1 Tax=Clostridium sp. C8-1-8 TaxID=2698831 RepID=UPI00136AE3C8|nr:hypothetical protein [Clostridium sp. C8-1-8]